MGGGPGAVPGWAHGSAMSPPVASCGGVRIFWRLGPQYAKCWFVIVALSDVMSKPAVLLRYRNREVTGADVEFIRKLCAHMEWPRRNDLGRAICEAWDWRQPNGSYSVYACMDLLLRLEERGLVKLPACKPGSRRPGETAFSGLPLPPDLISLTWNEVRDPNADLAGLQVRPICADERLGWRLYMDRYHYLGDRTIVGEHLLYAAFLDNELVALTAWASAAFRAPLREAYIGWDEGTKRRRLHFVANNVRFLIPPWVRVRHLASKVLAANLRRLSADWQAAWRHPLFLAETFVDTTRFRGTCYRAANWVYLGETAGRTKRGNQYLSGGTKKALFVYPLRRHATRWLREGNIARRGEP